jgi:MFS family permease
MSTMTPQHPGRTQTDASARSRLVSGPVILVFASTFCQLCSFYLLVSVTPMYASSAGAGTAGAGLVTGALLGGTVAAELASPAAMNRFGPRIVLAAGAIMLGVPSLFLLGHAWYGVLIAASVVRGFGFGLGTVVLGALMAVLVPADRRGEGIGLFGIADTVPAVAALPSGVWIAGHGGYPLVVTLAAVMALAPVAAAPWLPGRAGRAGAGTAADAASPGERAPGLLAGLRDAGQRRLALIFAASTVSAGIVVSFLPLAAGVSRNVAAAGLLAQALTATAAQWWAGWYGDRHGHRRLLIPGLVIATAGMTAMIWLGWTGAVIAGMCLFGAGFGFLQNSTFVLMIERGPACAAGTASAIWSLAYDAGYGAGPVAFGLFVTMTGYPAGFALTGLLMLIAVPAARSARARPGQPGPGGVTRPARDLPAAG